MNATDLQTFNQAVGLAQSGQKQQAYQQLASLRSANPQDGGLLLWLAFTSPNLKESEAAIQELEKLDPANSSLASAKQWLATEKGKRSTSPLSAPPVAAAPPPPTFQPNPFAPQPVPAPGPVYPSQPPNGQFRPQPPTYSGNPAQEVVIYQDPTGIYISNMRAVLGPRTYSISNITSVSINVVPAKQDVGTWLLVVGGLFWVGAIWYFQSRNTTDALGFALAVIGTVLIGAGIYDFVLNWKTRFAARIGSASGETDGIVSPDERYIRTIVGALNEAMIRRG
jgi:hypothetical protein